MARANRAVLGGLAVTVVSWLGDWPPAFEAPIELDPDRGWSYAVDRGPAAEYAFLTGTSAMPPGISYAFVNPDQEPFSLSVETSASSTRALSVRAGKCRHLVGMEEPGPFLGGDSYHLLAGWVRQVPDGIHYEGPYIVGCSLWPGQVDGIETSMGWLVAAPVPYDQCSDDSGPGYPKVLTVTRFAGDGTAYFGLSLPVAPYITGLHVVPRPAGGWIAYGVGADDMNPPRIEAVQMDAQGLLSQDPISLTPPGIVALDFDAAAFGGSGIATAFKGGPANQWPDLMVVVAGDQGIVASAQLGNDFDINTLHVLGNSPDGSILVAFDAAVGPEGSSVYLARFTCQP